jgi:hypothetical protein
MEYISFRELSAEEKIKCLKQAAAENKLKFVFKDNHIDFDKIANLKVYASFFKNEVKGFYFLYDLNEQTIKIAFGYIGYFSKNTLLTAVHVIKHLRSMYSVIGEVNSLNTATLKMCRKYLEGQEFILTNADNNNTDRHVFYWEKEKGKI